jgi:hypothetical protein
VIEAVEILKRPGAHVEVTRGGRYRAEMVCGHEIWGLASSTITVMIRDHLIRPTRCIADGQKVLFALVSPEPLVRVSALTGKYLRPPKPPKPKRPKPKPKPKRKKRRRRKRSVEESRRRRRKGR